MKKLLCLFAVICMAIPACANFELYLQPILDKDSNHSMENIDFIYMINLDERPEKWAMASGNLAPYDIHPYRFSAVNGWKLPVDTLNDLGVVFGPDMRTGILGTCYLPHNNGQESHRIIETYGQSYFCHCMAPGQIGTVLSFLSVLQDAYDSGYKTIWIMEDDIEVVRDPHILSAYIDELDRVRRKSWDILFTDRDTRNANGKRIECTGYPKRPNYTPTDKNRFRKRKNITKNIRRIGNRFGAYSMIIRRSGIKKILEFYKTYSIFFPIDLDYLAHPRIKAYTVRKDVIVHTLNFISDTGNSETREM